MKLMVSHHDIVFHTVSIVRRAFASFKYRTGTEAFFDYARDSYVKQRQLFEARRWGVTPPPRHLQERIVAGYFPRYIASGRQIAKEILSLAPGTKQSVLDFGCGSGRVAVPVSKFLPNSSICATDIDPEAIDWCRNHIAGVEFDVNSHNPPTRYPSGSFDLIYAVSVFTHLPEKMQREWLEELRRICCGYLVLSIHGQRHHKHIPPAVVPEFLKRGFYYLRSGTTDGLPDFYQSTFQTHDYIRSEWGKFFDIMEIKERAIGWGNHDAVVCKVR